MNEVHQSKTFEDHRKKEEIKVEMEDLPINHLQNPLKCELSETRQSNTFEDDRKKEEIKVEMEVPPINLREEIKIYECILGKGITMIIRRTHNGSLLRYQVGYGFKRSHDRKKKQKLLPCVLFKQYKTKKSTTKIKKNAKRTSKTKYILNLIDSEGHIVRAPSNENNNRATSGPLQECQSNNREVLRFPNNMPLSPDEMEGLHGLLLLRFKARVHSSGVQTWLNLNLEQIAYFASVGGIPTGYQTRSKGNCTNMEVLNDRGSMIRLHI